MKVSDYDYKLDETLIANKPLKKRDQSRLLVLDKKTNKISHHKFFDILDFLTSNDILVLNNTKVIPARIIGSKKDTNAKIEILLLKEIKKDIWEVLVKNVKRLKENSIIIFKQNVLEAKVLTKKEEGICELKFSYKENFYKILDEIGVMPTPPYIKEKLTEQARYQTVYAKNIGSVAAPTAGLHFTKELLEKLKEKGVVVVYVTLHVGLGTFRPMNTDIVEEHKMHEEYYEMTKEVADILNNTTKNIVAVGTTSVRTLEAIYQKYGKFKKCSGTTDIFIYPGYEFKVVKKLITNFHLPKSTLLLLVSAFASKEFIFKAYKEAIYKKYRFFSFGDAMFIK